VSENATQGERLYVGDVEVTRARGVQLERGDVLVVQAPMPLSPEQGEYIIGMFRQTFPDVEVLLLDSGLTLSAYRPVKE
jgi:hypothetical protein